jgi:hypothetical protein
MYINGKHISIGPEVDIHMPDVRVHNKGESTVETVLNYINEHYTRLIKGTVTPLRSKKQGTLHICG